MRHDDINGTGRSGPHDELPPYLGERYLDTLHDIHRANTEAQYDDQDSHA